ncbi:hypothetical protein C7401_11456 [Paraburkholderia unamae]|uniref:hypothetical protein n=1 Tax=Paraburkholderia unamae TaxID=219649 RepID=UPI000DC41FCE|nr:hypothetical protein [Paraburkholderia unamae]RAR57837.1 hypothetical protein C7401_11456 [Paraburkholderia unamae]
MTGRDRCRLLFVAVALCISATAIAGRGGGWVHGGGGGYGGGYGGGGYGGGYASMNHGGSWSGGAHGAYYGGAYHGGGYYHGGYWHGGYYGWHGGYYHGGWYGCCGSVSVGFYFGPGFIYGYPFYPYYYPPYIASVYYPYVSGDFSQPTQYIEQGQGQAQFQGGGADMNDQGGAAPELAYWYYCDAPQGYYPYVRACPGGWQKVPARPPDS